MTKRAEEGNKENCDYKATLQRSADAIQWILDVAVAKKSTPRWFYKIVDAIIKQRVSEYKIAKWNN